MHRARGLPGAVGVERDSPRSQDHGIVYTRREEVNRIIEKQPREMKSIDMSLNDVTAKMRVHATLLPSPTPRVLYLFLPPRRAALSPSCPPPVDDRIIETRHGDPTRIADEKRADALWRETGTETTEGGERDREAHQGKYNTVGATNKGSARYSPGPGPEAAPSPSARNTLLAALQTTLFPSTRVLRSPWRRSIAGPRDQLLDPAGGRNGSVTG